MKKRECEGRVSVLNIGNTFGLGKGWSVVTCILMKILSTIPDTKH